MSTSSELLPLPLLELSLSQDEDAGWRLLVSLLDGTEASIAFAGGSDPRDWLTQHLAAEYGFDLPGAAQVAHALFQEAKR